MRVLNYPSLDLLGEVILRGLNFKRSLERDHFKRSQFSPSHFERDPNDKSQFCRSHPSERGQYERSSFSQSGSPALREYYRNPNPLFGPKLPSRPRERGALPSFLLDDTRTIPVLQSANIHNPT